MTRTVKVHTPGRLHFGLSSFGGSGRQFSGLGMMVDGEGVALRISPATSFQASGQLRERIEKFAEAFAAYHQLKSLPACQIEVVSNSPEHTGLGIGTQLGLAVVAGMSEWLELPWRDANLLSQVSGRGRRSAIGTHGFLHGGLLVDAGKLPDEPLGTLSERVDLPSQWRVLLIRQPVVRGLAGPEEKRAIDSLPPVPADVTQQLQLLIEEQILPAARDANWQQYSEALFDYGYRAGECFAPVQGGPYSSPEIARCIDKLRSLGLRGVGQSSWGPTIFAMTSDPSCATHWLDSLKGMPDFASCEISVATPNLSGARVSVV